MEKKDLFRAILLSVFIIFSSCKDNDTDSVYHWKYGTGEEKNWEEHFKDCAGISQSPVRINRSELIYNNTLGPFNFYGYFQPAKLLSARNNGHTIQIDVTGDISVDGGGLHNRYDLLQFHFHWGLTSDVGSEHIVYGKQYPMEMHFVHRSHDMQTAVAIKANKGLAVLGFLFEISPTDNVVFEPIIKGLEYIPTPGLQVEIQPFALMTLFPANLAHYYRYYGSLTTPPCFESVQWTLFAQPIKISEKQLDKFRALLSHPGEHMYDNYRDPQPLYGREVYTSRMGDMVLNATSASIKMAQPRTAHAVSAIFTAAFITECHALFPLLRLY